MGVSYRCRLYGKIRAGPPQGRCMPIARKYGAGQLSCQSARPHVCMSGGWSVPRKHGLRPAEPRMLAFCRALPDQHKQRDRSFPVYSDTTGRGRSACGRRDRGRASRLRRATADGWRSHSRRQRGPKSRHLCEVRSRRQLRVEPWSHGELRVPHRSGWRWFHLHSGSRLRSTQLPQHGDLHDASR